MKERELYRDIPRSRCKDGCFACCTFVIQATPEEQKAMGGYEYRDGACCHLIDRKCAVYENRPLVCRIYGTSEILRCEDCVPERFLSEEETRALIHTYVTIKNEEENEAT